MIRMSAPELIPLMDTGLTAAEAACMFSAGRWAGYRDLKKQIDDGPSWLFESEEAALALVGLWPFREHSVCVAWFACLPSLRSHIRRFVREARIVLAAQAAGEFILPSRTVTVVIPGHAPGERLARLLGFEATGRMIYDYQLWEMQHGARA